MIGRIIKIVSREYTLLDEEGRRYPAILMGKVRRQDVPAAGDLAEAENIQIMMRSRRRKNIFNEKNLNLPKSGVHYII